MGPQWSKKSPKTQNYALFRKKMILRAKNGFGAKKVKLSEKVRNGGKWSPKHLKKDRFRKVLSDRAGNGIPGTKKVDFFLKKSHFSPQNANFRNVANFSQKVLQIRFWRGKIVCTLKNKAQMNVFGKRFFCAKNFRYS